MDAPNADQMPEGWSDGASGYDENFAGFTGLYAEEMLDLLHVGEGSRVLDVAAGSGATSVRAARRGAEVTATDFAEGMVAIAERRLREGGHTSSRAVRMDGQALDLPDGAFDAAVSMFGLMFFPDTAAGVAEMRRVVRPGGRVGTATWDLDAFPMHRLIGAALEVAVPELAGQDRPRPTWAALGTEPGLAAITRLIGEGLNVNVTLLFSVDRHRAVMDAYMAGLERRRDAGGKLDHIASVASFFVSRVDAKVDGLLPEGHDLRGKVAIANARAAYGAFLEVTASERWQSLAADGAKPQRPLWASTSTKDPSLPDTLYVDELVGPQTVNTVPEPTMDATRDHGAEPTDNLNGRVDEALALLARLPELGVDLGQVTKELETEGVEKFVDSFEGAVATVAGDAD